MEKSCEGRRAGNGASSARRQRTGYKEFSDGDIEELIAAELNARLRERVKDPAGGILLQGSIKRRVPSSSHIKRKRNSYQDAHIQTRARFSGGIDETSESAEAGASDEDDMPPPAVPQGTVNSRPQEKFQEGVSVIVPRKARTAIMKRFQDSPQRGAEISAGCTSPVTFRAPAPPNRTSNVTSKPGKKPKLRSGKVPKAINSPVISEQEVEAAEALSDLSRMFVNPVHDKEVLDANSKLQPGFAVGNSVALPASSSPLRAPTSVSSPDLSYSSGGAVTPLVGTSQQAEVLKRKRPRVKPYLGAIELNMEACINTAVPSAAPKEEPDQVGLVFCTTQSSLELDSAVAALGEPVTASSPNARASSSILNFPVNSKCVLPAPAPEPKVVDQVSSTIDSEGVEVDTSASDSMKKDLKIFVVSDKCKSDKLPTTAALLKDVKICKGSLCAAPPYLEHEVSRRSPSMIQEVSPVKLEIDLMASPPQGNNEHLGAAKRNEQEALIQKSSSSSLEKETVVSVLRGDDKEDESAAEHIGEVVVEQNVPKQIIKEQKGRELIELNRQQPQNSGRNVKADIRWARNFERSGVSYQPSSGLSTSTLDKGTQDKLPLPVSVNLPGWPGVLPTLGYYGPAAAAASVAAWPGVASLAKPSVCKNNPIFQLPSSCVIPPRQTWKRCASHVYIARFISVQQQMAGNPFFAATYGDPANLYTLPPTDSIYGTAAAAFIERNVSGPSSSSNMLLSAIQAGTYGVGPLSSKEFRGALTNSGAKHRVSTSCTDAVLRISLQEQSPSKEHKFSSPLQISTSAGSSVSATVSLKVPGTTGAPGMLSETSGGTHNSTHTGDSESPLSRAGPSTTNSTSVTMASVQAQYIQAVMQQNTFPFMFSHFGSASFPNASVHVGQQQPPQFFNTQYFHSQPPTQASQQTQQPPNIPAGLAPQQKQQLSRSSLQHPLQTSPQQVQCQQAEESNSNVSGTNTLAESKFLIRQQNFYGHASSSAQIPSSVNLSPSITTTFVKTPPLHQDFGHFAAPGIKRNCKNQQQKQLTPMQRQSQQLSGLPSNMLSMQQMQVNGGTPGFSLGLKGLDAQPSETFHGISVTSLTRGSVGPGPLGLAPVAAVMAPEGHAVLPNVVDPRKSHTQYQPSKTHHSEHPKHANHAGQQQEASVVVQKFAAGGVDDVRSGIGSSTHNSTNHGGNLGEDKKSSATRALGSSSLTRVDFETQLSSSNVNSINPPFSRTINNGSLILTGSNSFPSHPGGQMSSFSLPMPNIATNQSSKQTAPRDKVLPSQNVVIPSTSTSDDRASLAMTFAKGTPPGLSFPSPQVSNSNNQSQAQPSQHPPVKSLQNHTHGSFAGASESSEASPLAAGKNHMQPSRNSPATGASPAPRFASPISSPASGSVPSPPLPPISKSPFSSSSSPKIVGTAKSSSQAAQKASTATGKRTSTAASIVGTTPTLQSMPFKASQLQMQPAQQMQASQLQPTILPASFQQSPLTQHFQQQQSHPTQQQSQQAQKQSLQQQQQIFFQQQHQHYLHQQHHKLHSQPQGHPKNQQNQTVLHQSQQQHLGAQPPSQSRQQSSMPLQQVLQHLRQQKPHHQSAYSSALSNLTGSSSPSQSTLTTPSLSTSTTGSSTNVYAEVLTETLLFNENGSNCGGSRQNLSDSVGITGAYLQAHSNSGPIIKKLEQTAVVDGQCQEQVKRNLSVASSTPCRSPATTASPSSFDLPAARITTSVVPNNSVAGQMSGVTSVENVALKTTASICTSSTVTATARIPSSSNDCMTKKVGSYSDSDLGSIGKVSVSGTSASLHHQWPEYSVQPNNSTHQMSTSTTPCPLPNTSSNAQAG